MFECIEVCDLSDVFRRDKRNVAHRDLEIPKNGLFEFGIWGLNLGARGLSFEKLPGFLVPLNSILWKDLLGRGRCKIALRDGSRCQTEG